MISKDEVVKIAKLSKLTLTDEEVTKTSDVLSETLVHINVLKELDTSNVGETYQVTGLHNVFSTKQNNNSLTQKEALSNASKVENNLFVTEGVFDRS